MIMTNENKGLERAEKTTTHKVKMPHDLAIKAMQDILDYANSTETDLVYVIATSMALDALKRETKPNEPLTLEELRGMDGEPVWVEFVGKPDGSLIPPLWMLVNVRMRQLVTDVEYVDWSDEGWLAYRRKPDGGGE